MSLVSSGVSTGLAATAARLFGLTAEEDPAVPYPLDPLPLAAADKASQEAYTPEAVVKLLGGDAEIVGPGDVAEIDFSLVYNRERVGLEVMGNPNAAAGRADQESRFPYQVVRCVGDLRPGDALAIDLRGDPIGFTF